MFLFKKTSDLHKWLESEREKGESIGFIPTMGALHPGHVSLIMEAKRRSLKSVCSIFVNPTQFNDSKDLEKYPRTLAADIQILMSAGCDAVFAPDYAEVYPQKQKPDPIHYGDISHAFEGAFRPGHFDGVVQVVERLFEMVKPKFAFFGLKDYQQCMVIQEMVVQKSIPVELVFCPIVRESDGLAMSSRNQRLSTEERIAALKLSEALLGFGDCTVANFQKKLQEAKSKIESNPLNAIEYIRLAHPRTLAPIDQPTDAGEYILLAAIFTGQVRLIDNISLQISLD